MTPSPEGLESIPIAAATRDQIAGDIVREMLRDFDHMGDPNGIAYVETVERAIRIVRGLE